MATTTEIAPKTPSRASRPDSVLSEWQRLVSDSESRLALLGASLCGILLGLMYASNLMHFVQTWSTDENYSHGFLVPLLGLYFAREAMREGPLDRRGGQALGVGLLVVSVLARLATVLVPVGIVGDVGFLIGIAGICALMAGRDALKRYGFAIGFLIFMVPLPVALYSALASPLQMIVSRLGSSLLNVIGIPVLCEGNMMTLPGNVRMFVAEACSGMRQLTGFLALTTAVAYLSTRPGGGSSGGGALAGAAAKGARNPYPFWYRAALVVSSVPIAMTANVLRVTLTGVIMYHLDPSYASGKFHTLEGLLMMAVGLGLLGLECAALKTLTMPRSSQTHVPAPATA
ncbi:MAG: eight transrane protein EpsH, putative exosortase [Planctomycetota bacterium]|nr:eight transrane protein EpsH, putative exosortase [Planctomycetota bacterium]